MSDKRQLHFTSNRGFHVKSKLVCWNSLVIKTHLQHGSSPRMHILEWIMQPVSHTKTGIILVVKNFDACVAFYRDLFGLRVLHEKEHENFRLACFAFGGSYLMIESEKPHPQPASEKSLNQNPTKLRFNVPDIKEALKVVRDFGLNARIDEFEWGSTINLTDPDGNRVGIRDDAGFENDNAVAA